VGTFPFLENNLINARFNQLLISCSAALPRLYPCFGLVGQPESSEQEAPITPNVFALLRRLLHHGGLHQKAN